MHFGASCEGQSRFIFPVNFTCNHYWIRIPCRDSHSEGIAMISQKPNLRLHLYSFVLFEEQKKHVRQSYCNNSRNNSKHIIECCKKNLFRQKQHTKHTMWLFDSDGRTIFEVGLLRLYFCIVFYTKRFVFGWCQTAARRVSQVKYLFSNNRQTRKTRVFGHHYVGVENKIVKCVWVAKIMLNG